MPVFANAAINKSHKIKQRYRYQKRLMAIASCAVLALAGSCSGTNWGTILEQRVSPIAIEMQAELPTDFPQIVPVYEPARLVEIRRSPSDQSTVQNQVDRANATTQVFSQWQTNASIEAVTSFYTQAFSDNDWQMLLMPAPRITEINNLDTTTSSSDSSNANNSTDAKVQANQPDQSDRRNLPEQTNNQVTPSTSPDPANLATASTQSNLSNVIFLAYKDDLLVTVSIAPQAQAPDRTEILLQYVQNNNLRRSLATIQTGTALPNPPGTDEKIDDQDQSSSTSTDNAGQIDASSQNSKNNQDQSLATSTDRNATDKVTSRTGMSTTPTKLSDLNTVPQSLQDYVRDMARLGAIDPAQGNQFQPNGEIKRRDYARWLVLANNRIYQGNPSRQIRLALTADKPTFADVQSNDPDFIYIQALANAGLIGAAAGNNQPLFKPDAPLSREDMITWKVPLDLQDGLPSSATVATVKQAWNFQDSDRIAPGALQAVLGDDQLGDLSNIRRSFGYTTIFQPKKPVTRAEAAAALWHFGTATNGISAQDILQTSATSSASPTIN
jgi:hypothetical protein